MRYIRDAGDIIHFGSRGQLRRAITPLPANHQAHHIIPWELGNHDLVQRAARSADSFHLNMVDNGIGLPKHATTNNPGNVPFHNGSHANYSNQIRDKLDDLMDEFPNMTDNEAAAYITDIIQDIRSAVTGQGGVSINAIDLGL